MNLNRRRGLQLLAASLATPALPLFAHGRDVDDDDDGHRAGRVFTMSNATSGNELLVYATSATGAPELLTRVATQGLGSGGGLGSQGALTLAGDGRRLFVLSGGNQRVNAYGIRADGGLETLGAAGGFLPGAVGLAAN